MGKRRVCDDELFAHFVTFSCYRRRRLLDHDRAKKIVLGVLGSQLRKQQATCVGFVVMPNHVHAVVWFPVVGQLSHFMKQWKQRSSVQIKRVLHECLTGYAATVEPDEAFWQRKYYVFHLYSEEKMREKLDYMHANPVRAGLVERPCDWPWSSARYYQQRRSVGVPVRWVQ